MTGVNIPAHLGYVVGYMAVENSKECKVYGNYTYLACSELTNITVANTRINLGICGGKNDTHTSIVYNVAG